MVRSCLSVPHGLPRLSLVQLYDISPASISTMQMEKHQVTEQMIRWDLHLAPHSPQPTHLVTRSWLPNSGLLIPCFRQNNISEDNKFSIVNLLFLTIEMSGHHHKGGQAMKYG